MEEYESIFDTLHGAILGQNLDRRVKSKSSTSFSYDFSSSTRVVDKSGNEYDGIITVNPTSSIPGALFSGSASSILAGNGSIANVMMITGGKAYILNYTLLVNVWTDAKVVGINSATCFVVKENSGMEQVHEFTTTIGDYSNCFIWNNPMNIEAPIAEIGAAFEGMMKSVVLKDGAHAKYAGYVKPLVIGVAPCA